MAGHPDDMQTLTHGDDPGRTSSFDLVSALPPAPPPEAFRPAGARPAAVDVPPFAVLYEEYFDFVWRSARRLGVYDSQIDDVVQDVFLTVYRRLADFEGRSSVKTWIFGILRHTVSDARRSARRKPVTALDAEPIDSGSISPHDAAQNRQGAELLQQALSALPDEQRDIFVLAELEQLSAPEIASALELNLNTVYSRLRSARLEFEAALKRLRSRDEWRIR